MVTPSRLQDCLYFLPNSLSSSTLNTEQFPLKANYKSQALPINNDTPVLRIRNNDHTMLETICYEFYTVVPSNLITICNDDKKPSATIAKNTVINICRYQNPIPYNTVTYRVSSCKIIFTTSTQKQKIIYKTSLRDIYHDRTDIAPSR